MNTSTTIDGRRSKGLAEVMVHGAIVDSWVEPAGTCDWGSRLILQVAPRERPRELMIVEADATLVPDLGWLADLGENLCHGSPVAALACPTRAGLFRASRIELDR